MRDTFNTSNDRDKVEGKQYSKENEKRIRTIPVFPEIKHIIRTMIKTQDIFFVGFYPDSNEYDISIYEFKNFGDIHDELAKKLEHLNLRKDIKKLILNNLDHYSQSIEDDIKHHGKPHFWNIFHKVEDYDNR